MARTISASRPVGPAGYGATAQGIMDEVARRSPGAFMGNARAQEAMAMRAAGGIGEQELARDIAHQGRVAQAISSASRAEGQMALQRERLEDARAAADDWRPKVARIAGAVAPALALGAQAYEHYNSPAQQALRAAKAARPDSSMPMPGEMNPQDLATLQAMSDPDVWAQPMQFDEAALGQELRGVHEALEMERLRQVAANTPTALMRPRQVNQYAGYDFEPDYRQSLRDASVDDSYPRDQGMYETDMIRGMIDPRRGPGITGRPLTPEEQFAKQENERRIRNQLRAIRAFQGSVGSPPVNPYLEGY